MVIFEEDRLVVKNPVKLLFGRTTEIGYEDIEKIEFIDGGDVFFYLKNGKVRKFADPGIVMFYTEFGDMLKAYRIPYTVISDEVGDASIETVREKAVACREIVLAYLNRSVKEKLGPEYEFEVRIAERLIGTSLEFRLLKNGFLDEDSNQEVNSDGEPIVDELDVAYLHSWEPMYERAGYLILKEATDRKVCEDYLESDVLPFIYRNLK